MNLENLINPPMIPMSMQIVFIYFQNVFLWGGSCVTVSGSCLKVLRSCLNIPQAELPNPEAIYEAEIVLLSPVALLHAPEAMLHSLEAMLRSPRSCSMDVRRCFWRILLNWKGSQKLIPFSVFTSSSIRPEKPRGKLTKWNCLIWSILLDPPFKTILPLLFIVVFPIPVGGFYD